MEFLIGCNYWASNAGTDMWRNFDINIIKNDIHILKENGVQYLRVFPNWRDFQPVIPMIKGAGVIYGYCLENDIECKNEYYLNESMLDKFSDFLKICSDNNVKVVVGLITGWMSGRLFVPPALFGKNVITDPLAIHFQQLFIKGFVSRFKNNEIIYAWDLGNECNCMGSADRIDALNWTAIISNAIKAEDNSRMIISGMHGLSVEKNTPWRIADQAMFTDVLTTHPYPYWCQHTRVDNTLSERTLMHATAETKLYSEIGNRPCLAEEIGTMGPMICSDEKAADFLRVNLFSLWANNSLGVMWWCAHDQTMLNSFPYTDNMVEVELGMLDKNLKPKPVLKEMKRFADFLKNVDFKLPKAETQAVCLLTETQRQWGIGYMTYALLRKIGLNCKFAFAENSLPESNLYIVPSINGTTVMKKKIYEDLKQRVYDGADAYISVDSGVLSEFMEFTGMKVIDSSVHLSQSTFTLCSENINIQRNTNLILDKMNADILAFDDENNPVITVNKYGKGRVFFVNFPLENNLVDMPDALEKNYDLIYKELFSDYIDERVVKISGDNLVLTEHFTDDGLIVIVINNSDKEQELVIEIKENYKLEKIYYGSAEKISAYDACVLEYRG